MTINVKKVFDYWFEEVKYSQETADTLFTNKKYPESLFFYHLAIEKLFKAIVVATTKEHAPPLHDLISLSKKTHIPFTQSQISDLKLFNDFYLSGRYDEYKMEFRKLCTKEYTDKKVKLIKKYIIWLTDEAKKISPAK